MRFLADENCDLALVHGLRAEGHDVLCVSEISPRADDSEVVACALHEKRILLTEDKDFGQLVYAYGRNTLGVIFLRFPVSARSRISKEVLRLVKERGDSLIGSFVTVQPGKIRISRPPG